MGVLSIAVLFAIAATLRYTKSAVLNDEKKRLGETTRSLVQEYEDRADSARWDHQLPSLNNPDSASSGEVLSLLSRLVLQNAEGVSGGFYSSAKDTLLGSYSPKNEDSPEAWANGKDRGGEREAVLETARSAAHTRQASEKTLLTPGGVVLIQANPIRDGYTVAGSAWSIKRIPELQGTNRFRAYLIVVGLGTAALASVLLTLLMIRNLQVGVRKIEGGLQSLEGNLDSPIDTADEPEEIQHVVQAIRRLGATLKDKIEHEQKIESQLRQAERLASLGRLVAGVAHEVRNPLATIRLRVQMCGREAEIPRVKESCLVALEEIERLDGMVNRLLNFARPVQLRLEPADLKNIVEERMEIFRELARQSGVDIVTKTLADDLSLPVDKGRMAQIFDNVIVNAIEAMSESGGTLFVTLASHRKKPEGRNGVCVEFRDTGKGMNPAVVSHVFDPFFTTKSSGTGLGLSICHELVRAHGGDIRVESEEGRGTNVKITIPASSA